MKWRDHPLESRMWVATIVVARGGFSREIIAKIREQLDADHPDEPWRASVPDFVPTFGPPNSFDPDDFRVMLDDLERVHDEMDASLKLLIEGDPDAPTPKGIISAGEGE